MRLSRRGLIRTGAASLAAGAAPGLARTAPRRESWDSLAARRGIPDWFRDAKLGIWAHWGPQCVPEFGDWYGRLMYQQGSPAYEHHLKTYGHPTRHGFLEIIGRWRAEAWDPQTLLDLYQAAGAKYLVAMANHHDNFDNYASTHHDWNSVRVGPKRDIVGTWARLARARGLPFGVSNHGAHAWHWWQTAYGYDPEGALKGQRYDAGRLTRADGKGTWWQGLDPQALYTGPNLAPPVGIDSIAAMERWHEAHDGVWSEDPPPGNPGFVRKWSLRCRELIDRYQPDLLYFDDTGLPLGQAGLDVTGYYYDASRRWSGGRRPGVVTGKLLTERQRAAIVEDVERGFSDRLREEPWQTDTCIGDWHYNRARFERHSYTPAKNVAQRLCDVVSKNGNLLLNIPLRGDGSLDADERKILQDLAGWMRANGEAIFATRPWKVFGEGPTRLAAGMKNEDAAKPFVAADIRYTTKGDALYALPLEWPTGELRLVSLGAGAQGEVRRVELLGEEAPLPFRRDADGLVVSLPERRPAFTPALRIEGPGLV